jgi:hypothetical protein
MAVTEAPDTNGSAWRGLKPRFSWEINLGHVLQILALVISVGGGAVVGYISLRGEIDSQRADRRVALAGFETRMETQRAEARVVMAGVETRLSMAERAIAERQTEQHEFAAEMRAALTKISDQLSELRVQVLRPRGR